MVMSLEQEAFADVLKSLHKLFFIETTDLFFGSVLEVHGQLGLVPSKEQYECYESKRDLIHAGLDRWLESLVVVCQKYVRDITQIVPSYPQHITGDRAHWARLQIEDLVGTELRQKLSSEELVLEAHERRLKLQDQNAVQSKVQSRIGSWFRRVCDGLPDFECSESGFHEPWTAPGYCEETPLMRVRIKRHGSCPERLTAKHTNRIIWRAERQFGGRLEHVLNVAEDQSRIVLASQPAGRELKPSGSLESGANTAPDGKEQDLFFSHSTDYRNICYGGSSYVLTTQQAAIIQVLHQAGKTGTDPVSTAQIKTAIKCGKISDSFRAGDGPELWKRLIVPLKGRHGMYRLDPGIVAQTENGHSGINTEGVAVTSL